jgi:16S rRNA (guanine(527)-N(7))-methyltransferase RsmG
LSENVSRETFSPETFGTFEQRFPAMTTALDDPGEVAAAARTIVEDFLAQVGYQPPKEEFFRRIEKFAAALALWGSKLNLTSAPNDPAEIALHVIDSLAPLILAERAEGSFLAGAFAAGARVLDLGSGAGFPSLILAAACDANFTLLEARRKRASFLTVTAGEMGLSNVRVDATRADTLTLGPEFETVTARAFAEPAIVYRTAASALKPGGRLILYTSLSQKAVVERASLDGFERPVFVGYEVPRGAATVAHLIAVSRWHV